MAITKRTILDEVTINRTRTLHLRLGILIEENGDELASRWHRVTLPPGTNIDAIMASVNAQLVAVGSTAVPAAAITIIKNVAADVWP